MTLQPNHDLMILRIRLRWSRGHLMGPSFYKHVNPNEFKTSKTNSCSTGLDASGIICL